VTLSAEYIGYQTYCPIRLVTADSNGIVRLFWAILEPAVLHRKVLYESIIRVG
jgi:hypothetical protein